MIFDIWYMIYNVYVYTYIYMWYMIYNVYVYTYTYMWYMIYNVYGYTYIYMWYMIYNVYGYTYIYMWYIIYIIYPWYISPLCWNFYDLSMCQIKKKNDPCLEHPWTMTMLSEPQWGGWSWKLQKFPESARGMNCNLRWVRAMWPWGSCLDLLMMLAYLPNGKSTNFG